MIEWIGKIQLEIAPYGDRVVVRLIAKIIPIALYGVKIRLNDRL